MFKWCWAFVIRCESAKSFGCPSICLRKWRGDVGFGLPLATGVAVRIKNTRRACRQLRKSHVYIETGRRGQRGINNNRIMFHYASHHHKTCACLISSHRQPVRPRLDHPRPHPHTPGSSCSKGLHNAYPPCVCNLTKLLYLSIGGILALHISLSHDVKLVLDLARYD